MGAALADMDPFDGCAAGLTGISSFLVNLAHILKTSIAVYPVDTGPIQTNSFF